MRPPALSALLWGTVLTLAPQQASAQTHDHALTGGGGGLADPGFEDQTPGTTPESPWTVFLGAGHVVNPAPIGPSGDNALPSDGSLWVELGAHDTDDAAPPTNPGGETDPPVGGAGISQAFDYPAGLSTLAFEAAFLRNEGAAAPLLNDWMSVDVSDGVTTHNLYYADTHTPTPLTSSRYGLPMTAVETVTVDLAARFPSSTPATRFVLTAQVGNGHDGRQPSRGYVDAFRFVAEAPVAHFSASPTSGQAPLAVDFVDETTGAVSHRHWDFGDGATSTLTDPSHTYTQSGTYTVQLTATGPSGTDTSVMNGLINVTIPPPIADFIGSPTSGLAPLRVFFQDRSSGVISSRFWEFGDGATSTLQDPNHTYANPGSYDVTLTVSGIAGSDTEVKAGFVTVGPPAPVADFGASPTNGAAPLTVDFTDASTGTITSRTWNFGDGSGSGLQNPSHTYSAPGTYDVSLMVSGPGGSDTNVMTGLITVVAPPPVADFGAMPTSGVAPLAVTFSDLSTGNVTSWSWTFGDGGSSSLRNPAHTYVGPGTYDVSLTVSGPGGMDTRTRNGFITVTQAAPVAAFGASPTSGVAPLAVAFTDQSTGAVTSRSWTFGDGGSSNQASPDHVYQSPGTYTVSLTVTGPGGSDTETKVDLIQVGPPAPVADFSAMPTSGSAPLSVSFTDLSTGPVTSRSWNFGDGSGSAAQNPNHVYNGSGVFTVSLTVTGPGGSNTKTVVDLISVESPIPAAAFSATPTVGTPPLTVAFEDLSTGVISSWFWTFGDGETSTEKDPSHVYADAGSYDVGLTVTGPDGTDTLSRPGFVTVDDAPPTAAFKAMPKNGVAPLTVQFTDQSTGPITNWSWNFGDGESALVQHPSHTYTSAGTYAVSLSVSGSGGNDSVNMPGLITVGEPPPSANFSAAPTVGTLPLTVNFFDLTTGNVTGWSWTFGDGGTSTAQSPDHAYTAPGVYTVSLTSSGPGGSDVETKAGLITVGADDPVAAFSAMPTKGVAPFAVDFVDESTGGPTAWTWDFGDGDTSNARHPSHVYDTPGIYPVSLTVTAPGGTDTLVRTGLVVVAAEPASLSTYGCGVNPAGSLTVVAGVPALGTTVVLGVDNPAGTQSSGARPFIALSLAPHPSFPCGGSKPNLGMDGPGELLISVAPGNRLRPNVAGPLWNGPGQPALVSLRVPDECGLIGLYVYAQGVLFDPTQPQAGVRIALADAVELRIGP